MSAPQVHSRRRPLQHKNLPHLSITSSSSTSDQSSSDSTCRLTPHSMKLKKGATFHSPTTPPSEDSDPIFNIHSLLRRSPTCPKALEDVIAAGVGRRAVFLDKFERSPYGLGSDLSAPRLDNTLCDNDSPVPRGMPEARMTNTDPMNDVDSIQKDKAFKPVRDQDRRRRLSCDSGIGSSISGASMSSSVDTREQVRKATHSFQEEGKIVSTQSAITRSISSTTALAQIPSFSVTARKHIDRFILVPILREKRLSPFHPLIRSVPQRIESKEIACLRDLEKTILFLAPVSQIRNPHNVPDVAYTINLHLKRYTQSKAVYLGFCEFTIQCLHTTVGYLNDRDQRRPSDRPYTNGYFLDLVEQMRQYAALVGATRERQGPRPRSRIAENNMEYSSDEEVTLEGGLGATGRPAELVRRKKDKQAISLRTGNPYDEKASPAVPIMKRSLSMESCDDGVARSMARRKKNAPPLDINQKCKDCDKVFKRPCDLTKHEKTHSRPWKCAEKSCKYFEIGWPTEKERDRHVNDKHSKSPPLFKCHFSPCTYQSKRQSNCKQHMEKAHGWVYIRSKNNGKSGSRVSGSTSGQPTPRTPNIQTPNSGVMDLPTPQSHPGRSPYAPNVSPYDQSLQYTGPSGGYPLDDMMDPHNHDFQLFPDSTTNNNLFDDFDINNPFAPQLDFSAFQASLEAGDPNEYVPSLDMHIPSVPSSATTPDGTGPMGPGTLTDESPFEPTHPTPNFNVDFDNLDNEYTVMNMQLLTPAQSVEVHGLRSFSRNPSPTCPEPQQKTNVNHNFSPAGQGNLMLYSPNSQERERDLDLDLDIDMDEGFHDGFDNYHNHNSHIGMGKPNGDFTLFESPSTTSIDGISKHANFDHSLGSQQNVHNFPALDSFANGDGGHFADSDAARGWPADQIDPMDLHRDVDEYIMGGF
ncbi:hypothetical protein HCAG_00239 [Histoplasma mississippiense (nom. inval.)]|uniref:hypothetical protein n=1 Tax=Ajellomyces capsulatus (strain NAm1 / WU24) TaxID=2059318 RepID=UPI000157B4E7|nr:hypothetical protein HCAG_00239 [Histoplasma mississippiense (nom. inval.)]EDN02375.1 hypothetical protein HCAG_00239 [Histoplasma mississippiense (nom. inval.)]